jgi:hypothetical protein
MPFAAEPAQSKEEVDSETNRWAHAKRILEIYLNFDFDFDFDFCIGKNSWEGYKNPGQFAEIEMTWDHFSY